MAMLIGTAGAGSALKVQGPTPIENLNSRIEAVTSHIREIISRTGRVADALVGSHPEANEIKPQAVPNGIQDMLGILESVVTNLDTELSRLDR